MDINRHNYKVKYPDRVKMSDKKQNNKSGRNEYKNRLRRIKNETLQAHRERQHDV